MNTPPKLPEEHVRFIFFPRIWKYTVMISGWTHPEDYPDFMKLSVPERHRVLSRRIGNPTSIEASLPIGFNWNGLFSAFDGPCEDVTYEII